ncbi:hypothetical protein NQZ68_037972 [Dissostichus eleginoides]|nr:hypothetical protein NQZ68_037972 [Dissostichus eleginoides]
MPVKAKRSALNYNLSITMNKAAMSELPKRRRRKGLAISLGRGSDSEEEKDNKDDEDEDDEFLPSEGSENEMETEILDYIGDDTTL